jgi:hypothetical protein
MLPIFSLLALISTAFAQDSAPCANMAKYGAIRAYKAEVGTIQGSAGIQYTASLTGVRGDFASYVVAISDNNEDGETWTVNYTVVVRKTNQQCALISVKKN